MYRHWWLTPPDLSFVGPVSGCLLTAHSRPGPLRPCHLIDALAFSEGGTCWTRDLVIAV
jgi:hypothetical protein